MYTYRASNIKRFINIYCVLHLILCGQLNMNLNIFQAKGKKTFKVPFTISTGHSYFQHLPLFCLLVYVLCMLSNTVKYFILKSYP